MSTKAFIDPNMFNLCEEVDILKNIDFFHQVISLCKQNRLSIVIYKNLLEKLNNRAIFPFPINVSDLSEPMLKQTILQLNQNFCNSMTNAWVPKDIYDCFGNQDFQTTPKLEDYYFELLSIMTSACYKCGLENVTNVLVGNINNVQKCGFEMELNCTCDLKNFHKKYFWISPSDLLSIKDIQLQKLKKLRFEKCDSPKLNRADHHAPFMPRNVQLRRYEEIPYNSRNVLSILCFFGLNCITFKDFHEDSSEVQGTITITSYKKNETNDIIYGNLYFNKGFKNAVELTFPTDVGECIALYCGKKIDYKTIHELATSLSMM